MSGANMGVSEQLVGVDCSLPPCVSWRIDLRLSGLMANTFTHEPSCCSSILIILLLLLDFFFKFVLSQGLSTYSWLSCNSYVGRLISNSQCSTYFCLTSTGIKSVYHYSLLQCDSLLLLFPLVLSLTLSGALCLESSI